MAVRLTAPNHAAGREQGKDTSLDTYPVQVETVNLDLRDGRYPYVYLPTDPNLAEKAGDAANKILAALEITKHADPDRVRAGEQITYTIQVTNTGDTALHATVIDTLPTHVLPGEMESGSLILPGGTLTWTPLITTPGGTWMQTVVVSVETDYAGPLTNTVQITTLEGTTGIYTETSTVYVESHVFLPFLTREIVPVVCKPQLLAELTTGPQPYQVALDVVGRRAFIAHADGVTVFDADTFAVITTTQAATQAHGIAFDPDRDRIWVTRIKADRVVVLDGISYTALADLPTGDEPHSVGYNTASSHVYVTNYRDGTTSVYNAETMTQVAELTNFAEPAHMAINHLTNKIYVANHKAENGVTVIDGATHDTHRIPLRLIDAYGVAVDVSRNLLYVASIAHGRMSIVDASTEEKLGHLDVRRSNGDRVPMRVIVVNPDMGREGHLLYVTSSEDGGRDQLLLLPNGWPTLGTPVPLDIASYPLEGIALDPKTDRVWVTSIQSGLVSVVQDGEPFCPTPLSKSVRNESASDTDATTNDLARINEH